MDNAELHLQYRYAIQLIKGQRYAEAYDVLKVIDAERPNTKKRAVCPGHRGRRDGVDR